MKTFRFLWLVIWIVGCSQEVKTRDDDYGFSSEFQKQWLTFRQATPQSDEVIQHEEKIIELYRENNLDLTISEVRKRLGEPNYMKKVKSRINNEEEWTLFIYNLISPRYLEKISEVPCPILEYSYRLYFDRKNRYQYGFLNVTCPNFPEKKIPAR
jgi:hypothetical protein